MTQRSSEKDPREIRKKWPARMPLMIGVSALFILVGVLGIWGSQARIAGAVIATGMIEVESNRQVIQHPEGGVVGEIFVRDGDAVEAGDALLRLDDTLRRSERAIIQDQLFEIRARAQRLRAERDDLPELTIPQSLGEMAATYPKFNEQLEGQKRLFEARKESLSRELQQVDEQITQSHNQISGAQAQLDAALSQEALLADELADSRALLERGLAQASRVSALERERARLLGQIGQLNASIAQLRGQIASFDLQKIQRSNERREEAITTLRDLQTRELELSERLLALDETLARMEIRSPVSGVVYGSTVFALKSVISPAQPIMYVIPQDQPLVVSARIESIHIDQVHIGQDVNLLFTAFDQRTTPEIEGQVARLSADVFIDEVTGLSYYEASLLPKAGALDKLGDQNLLPGMPVDAFIKTAERSPLSYLTKPLLDYFNKAFRES